MAFYTRFVCRLDPWPEPLMRTLNNVMSNPVPTRRFKARMSSPSPAI
jgi:hypothetical protein